METDPNETPTDPNETPQEPIGKVTASYLVRVHLRQGEMYVKDLEEIIERAIYAHNLVNASVSAERIDK